MFEGLENITLPLGEIIIPTGTMDVWFKPSLPPIVLRKGEALYIGALSMSLPDPLRNGLLDIRITTNDVGDETLNKFQARFPGTMRVENCPYIRMALRVLVWVNVDVFKGLATCKSVS